MGKDSFFFEKPVGILAGAMTREFNPPVEVYIQVLQNGFKVCAGEKSFVAKDAEEAKKIAGEQLDSILKEIKKKDK